MIIELNFGADSEKHEVFTLVRKMLSQKGLNISDSDEERPWGGFYYIDQSGAQQFVDEFFDGFRLADLETDHTISAKIIIVEPGKRLSWQYHQRRSEICKVINGPVGFVTSRDDNQGDTQIIHPGEMVKLQNTERHRIVGLDEWGIIAEIWQHTDSDNPSDEDDIVRLQDDHGRS